MLFLDSLVISRDIKLVPSMDTAFPEKRILMTAMTACYQGVSWAVTVRPGLSRVGGQRSIRDSFFSRTRRRDVAALVNWSTAFLIAVESRSMLVSPSDGKGPGRTLEVCVFGANILVNRVLINSTYYLSLPQWLSSKRRAGHLLRTHLKTWF